MNIFKVLSLLLTLAVISVANDTITVNDDNYIELKITTIKFQDSELHDSLVKVAGVSSYSDLGDDFVLFCQLTKNDIIYYVIMNNIVYHTVTISKYDMGHNYRAMKKTLTTMAKSMVSENDVDCFTNEEYTRLFPSIMIKLCLLEKINRKY